MSPKLFTIALLASAIPLSALANAGVTLTEGDFLSAQRMKRRGGKADDVVVSVKLSKSGKAKLRAVGKR